MPLPLPLPTTSSVSVPVIPPAQRLAYSPTQQPARLVPTIRFPPLPRRTYGTEPLPVRPSSDAPRQAKIVARVADVDNVAYTLEIGGVEVADVGLDEILDYVSALDLERFENECFVEERALLAVAEREERARKQAAKCRARAEKQARARGVFDFTSDEEEDDDDTDVEADAVTGTAHDGSNSALAVPATGRHGRARPTYTHLFLKTKARQSRKPDPRIGNTRHEDEVEPYTSSIGARLSQPRAAAESDSDTHLQIPRRRRRKRDKVTGELLPLSPTPPKPATLGSEGASATVDDGIASAELGKRQRRRRHPTTKQLMPLGWKYDPEAEGDSGLDSDSSLSHIRDQSTASDMGRLSLVRVMPQLKRARLTPAFEEENDVDQGSKSVAQSQKSPVRQGSLARQIPVAVLHSSLSHYDTPLTEGFEPRVASNVSPTREPQNRSNAQPLKIMDEDADEDNDFVNLPHWRDAKSSPGMLQSAALTNSTPQRKYQMLSNPIEIDSASSESDDMSVLTKFQKPKDDRSRADLVKTSIARPVAANLDDSSDEATSKLDRGSLASKGVEPMSAEQSTVEERDDVDDEEYFIEAILAHQLSDPRTHPSGSGDQPTMLYLVKWEGYEEPTWEPLASFEDPEIVLEYRRKAGLDGPSNSTGVNNVLTTPPANMIAAEVDSDGGHISI